MRDVEMNYFYYAE